MKFRTPYDIEKEFYLLDNTVGNSVCLDLFEREYFTNKGLYSITVRTNNSPLNYFEYIEVQTIYDKRIYPANMYYVSIFEPSFIVDAIYRDISQYEKELLYEYTSKYWNQIIDTFKLLYNDPVHRKDILEFNPYKNIDGINWPQQSPDYRLLPDCKL